MSARYRFDGTVKRLNTYGDRFETSTPTSVTAATMDEATEKARVAFGATYDGFRKFWSHQFFIDSVTEVEAPQPVSPGSGTDAPEGGE
jgi:hypothetical protein